MLEGGKSNINF